jgi:UDP-N-acetylmuramoylalanine--D-glutamate ligase
MSTASPTPRDYLVVGLGLSGWAAARTLLELGASVRVTESSSGAEIERRAEQLRSAGAVVETGGHSLERLAADVAVVSPGISPTSPVVSALRAADIPVIGEIELAWKLARCDFLAVTGTNGKSTTTLLLAEMLRVAGIASTAAGNIGTPLIDVVRALPEDGAVAVEVSSFQLDTIEDFRPRVAVILNVAEDHTDWHGSFEAYARAKARVTRNQRSDDVLVVNAEDEHAMEIAQRATARLVPFATARAPRSGAGVAGGRILWLGNEVMPVSEVALPGRAGLEDTLAAAAAALSYGVEAAAVVEAVRSFVPLPHRLQTVARRHGVAYIDDSKATNPHATQSAVRGLRDVVLIAGGRAKGIDLGPLAETVPPVIAVVALGEAAANVARIFEGLVPVERASSMREAVARAHSHATPGGSVLLSPGCASLDMYESYAARGEDFARCVAAELDEPEDAAR